MFSPQTCYLSFADTNAGHDLPMVRFAHLRASCAELFVVAARSCTGSETWSASLQIKTYLNSGSTRRSRCKFMSENILENNKKKYNSKN